MGCGCGKARKPTPPPVNGVYKAQSGARVARRPRVPMSIQGQRSRSTSHA